MNKSGIFIRSQQPSRMAVEIYHPIMFYHTLRHVYLPVLADELAESGEKIQEHIDRPCINGVRTPSPSPITTQQPDVLTKLMKKLKLLVPNTVQPGSTQCTNFLKPSGSSFEHRNQISYYHGIYGDDAKKCQPGCKYPKTDTITSQELSQELPEHPDDSNLVHDDIRDFLPKHATAFSMIRGRRKRKAPKSTTVNQQKMSQSVTQHRSPKHQLLLWRITRRKRDVNHTNPLLVPKPHNFTRKSRLRGSILQKTIPINLPTSSQASSPSTTLPIINHKSQPSSFPKATLMRKLNNCNLLAPPPIVFPDNVHPSTTRAQSSSKDTLQPPTPSVQSSLQDTIKSTTPPSCMSRPELTRIL
ncbi:hypothetical protein ACTXT7_015541 [Hymenolepis weldensis]